MKHASGQLITTARYTENSLARLAGMSGQDRTGIMQKLTVDRAVELLDVTYPTANSTVKSPLESEVLIETSGRSRHRSYEYRRYVELLWE